MAMKTLTNGHSVRVRPKPEMTGLSFRLGYPDEDYGLLAEITNDANCVDGVERIYEADGIAAICTGMPNVDPTHDLLIAEIDGQAVGYSLALWNLLSQGQRVYSTWGAIAPEHRRKGIGRALLLASESRLRQIAAGHPDDLPKRYGAFAWESQIGQTALLIREGYESVSNEIFMVRPDLENIPDLPLPEGIEVRPVRPEHLRAIYDAQSEALADDTISPKASEGGYQRFLTDVRTLRRDLWCVAWEGDQVVGMIRNYIDEPENCAYERRRGYTEWISVRKAWRRRGIARALLARSFAVLKAQGMQEAALGTDLDNPTKSYVLYESMGFQTVARAHYYQKPLRLSTLWRRGWI